MADAPIVMSEAVVIRYKPRHENKPKTFDNLISDSYKIETIYPFPVLEIQLVTKYANKMRGGELVNASFQVTVMDNEVNEEDESFIVDNVRIFFSIGVLKSLLFDIFCYFNRKSMMIYQNAKMQMLH